MSSSSSWARQAGRLAPRPTLWPNPALPRGALLGGMLAAPRRPALKERWLRCVASRGLHTPLDHLSNPCLNVDELTHCCTGCTCTLWGASKQGPTLTSQQHGSGSSAIHG